MPSKSSKTSIQNPFEQKSDKEGPAPSITEEPVVADGPESERPTPSLFDQPVTGFSGEDNFLEEKPPAFQMASQLFRFQYHPVVIFGGQASGKTALVTSLLASLRLSADWQIVAELNEPAISTETKVGREQKEESVRLFYSKVQQFIDGNAAGSTVKLAPFFLPLTVRSNAKNQSLKIALMESAGEDYEAKPNSPAYFASLRAETEAFIRDFEGGLSFIYVLPYTQMQIRQANTDISADPARLRAAEAAVVGMIEAYQKVRVNKSRDSHILVVTKWDAHYETKKKEEELEMAEILLATYDDLEEFLQLNYPQGLAAFKGLNVPEPKKLITNYCAGLISGLTISPMSKDVETRDAIRYHQKKLWKWIWRNASEELDGGDTDPFPAERRKTGFLAFIDRILERLG